MLCAVCVAQCFAIIISIVDNCAAAGAAGAAAAADVQTAGANRRIAGIAF